MTRTLFTALSLLFCIYAPSAIAQSFVTFECQPSPKSYAPDNSYRMTFLNDFKSLSEVEFCYTKCQQRDSNLEIKKVHSKSSSEIVIVLNENGSETLDLRDGAVHKYFYFNLNTLEMNRPIYDFQDKKFQQLIYDCKKMERAVF